MIISKASIRARAQQDAEAAKHNSDPRPDVAYSDNLDAQAVYEAAYRAALAAAQMAEAA